MGSDYAIYPFCRDNSFEVRLFYGLEAGVSKENIHNKNILRTSRRCSRAPGKPMITPLMQRFKR